MTADTLESRAQAAHAALLALGPASACRTCWRSPGHLCEAHAAATVERNRCWTEFKQGVPRLEEADPRFEDCRAQVEEGR